MTQSHSLLEIDHEPTALIDDTVAILANEFIVSAQPRKRFSDLVAAVRTMNVKLKLTE